MTKTIDSYMDELGEARHGTTEEFIDVAHRVLLAVARDQQERAYDDAIGIVKPWTDAYKFCREHFDDPCCHVRLGITITAALETAKAAAAIRNQTIGG